ncbi:hypothetical protein [Sharpea azabuensis]|uniref:hypothetical protein n=1 Tax=Sharpea azabuensis TaxID=322505 RepID=UPI001569BE3C|nr:hypothetical protein [Sharpea azabuensis]
MKTRHDYYEIIRKYAIEPKFIIPITNIRSLIIKSIVNDIVVGIEYYQGYRIEERDIHFYKYYFRDLYEKKNNY